MDRDKKRAKELFSRMTGKEKTAHLLRYYGGPALAVLAVAIMAAGVISGIVKNAAQSQNLYVGVPAAYADRLQPVLEAVATEAGEALNCVGLVGLEDISEDGYSQLLTLLAGDQLDLAVCDEQVRDFLLQEGAEYYTVCPLEQTRLAGLTPGAPEMYLVVRQGERRAERAQALFDLLRAVP